MRIPEGLRTRLEKSAKDTRKSMNSEILERLGRSFQRQDVAVEMLQAAYGRQLTGLLIAIGRTMSDTGTHTRFMATRSFEESSNW
ncbi:MAG: Arc family DNA-binding protein, partial [Planctomycetes bacterium]|nr:Arc family DNA-binding protein [Planctomycetota bacterium]